MEGIERITITPLDGGVKGYNISLRRTNDDPEADVPFTDEQYAFTDFGDMATFIQGLNGG